MIQAEISAVVSLLIQVAIVAMRGGVKKEDITQATAIPTAAPLSPFSAIHHRASLPAVLPSHSTPQPSSFPQPFPSRSRSKSRRHRPCSRDRSSTPGEGQSVGDVGERLGELSFDEGDSVREGRRRLLSTKTSRERSLSVKRKRDGEKEESEVRLEVKEEELSPYNSDDDSEDLDLPSHSSPPPPKRKPGRPSKPGGPLRSRLRTAYSPLTAEEEGQRRRVKECLKREEFTQSDLAKMCGVSKASMCTWLQGSTSAVMHGKIWAGVMRWMKEVEEKDEMRRGGRRSIGGESESVSVQFPVLILTDYRRGDKSLRHAKRKASFDE